MSTTEPREIAFEEICEGDDIEVVWQRNDRTDTSRGVAARKGADGWWRTRGGQLLAGPVLIESRTLILHRRPAPAELEGLGAVIEYAGNEWVSTNRAPGTLRWVPVDDDRTRDEALVYRWSEFEPDSIEVLSEGIEVES
jgi:hypothetical protein